MVGIFSIIGKFVGGLLGGQDASKPADDSSSKNTQEFTKTLLKQQADSMRKYSSDQQRDDEESVEKVKSHQSAT